MDRMSPLDASFLHIEDANNHMHVGSVAIFEGPPPAYERGPRRGPRPSCRSCPRYRQKVRFVPLDVGPPGVGRRPELQPRVPRPPHRAARAGRRGRAAPPGRPAHVPAARPLQAAVGDVDRRGPRGGPLGDGLQGPPLHGRRRLGHRPADACCSTSSATRSATQARTTWQPEPEPSTPSLLAQALVERMVSPYEGLRTAARRDARPAPVRSAGPREAGGGWSPCARWCGARPPSSLNAPIGPHRRWAWARSRLADVKEIRAGLGGTVNDVVLAAISNGFRELLLVARRAGRRGGDPHAGAGVGPPSRGARHLQQQGLGDVRRAAGRGRRTRSRGSTRSARR